MKINITPLCYTIMTIILSGCFSQSPAPIEYNSGQDTIDKSSQNKKIGSSSPKYSQNGQISQNDKREINVREMNETEKKFEDRPVGFLQDHRTRVDDENQDNSITVPKVKLNNDNIIYHEVKKGETLESISSDYDQQVESLATLNDLNKPYQLNESQIIQIKISNELLNKKNRENTLGNTENISKSNVTKFITPIKGKIVTQFGEQITKGNAKARSKGINILASEGSNVASIASGKVIFSGSDPKFGNLLIVKLDDSDLYVAYAYLRDVTVSKGAVIAQGQIVGHVGHTGNAQVPQLHFAIREGKIAVDPLKYVNINN